jgi:hypothetical protein
MGRWPFGPLVLAVAACAPAFDWREIRPDGAGVVALLPCRPDRFERTVEIAGSRVKMRLLSCTVESTTFAFGHVDMGDPAAVAPALAALRAAAAANLGASAPAVTVWQPPGVTPNPQAARLALAGRLPDGAVASAQAAFFARGTVACQATVLGPRLPGDAVETFFAGLRVGG